MEENDPNLRAIEYLEEISRLLELRGENPFKVRAYERAVNNLAGREDLLDRARAKSLTEIEGVGKGISEVLTEFLIEGKTAARDELAAGISPGLLELTKVPGLGPKKAMILIDELGIHSIAELEYACRENRLLKLKGFGPKMQEKILTGIQFQRSTEGRLRLSDAFPVAEKVLQMLNDKMHGARVSETGALRRRLETLGELEFLVEGEKAPSIPSSYGIKVIVHATSRERFGYELARTTGTDAHWSALGAPEPFLAATEEEFYDRLGLAWIPPEMRETGEEVKLARKGILAQVLPWNGVRGIFHNHTNRSDGVATLEQMVVAAKKLGYQYIGISDHSQSAFYAQGLKTPTLIEQESEVRAVQEKHPEIRIFWGIESDILQDGSLDYPDQVLSRFDFVIASIHSRFKMEREAMTDRILAAVRNPHTRFLGHVTGRLLLGRTGYDVDMERVIEEASRCGVAIEINSHPARLDIDWRWGPKLREANAFVSVNPDAHETAGLEDTKYGIAMARKALLPSAQVVNSRSVKDVEAWLKRA